MVHVGTILKDSDDFREPTHLVKPVNIIACSKGQCLNGNHVFL